MPRQIKNKREKEGKLLIPRRVALERCHLVQGVLRIPAFRVALSERVLLHLTSARVVLHRTLVTSIRSVNNKINLVYYSKCSVHKNIPQKNVPKIINN